MISCPLIIKIYTELWRHEMEFFPTFVDLLFHFHVPHFRQRTVLYVNVPQGKRKKPVQYSKDYYRIILRKSVAWFSINTGHAVCGWVN
jgi:hypothetical protein